jgi:hypothetical protein
VVVSPARRTRPPPAAAPAAPRATSVRRRVSPPRRMGEPAHRHWPARGPAPGHLPSRDRPFRLRTRAPGRRDGVRGGLGRRPRPAHPRRSRPPHRYRSGDHRRLHARSGHRVQPDPRRGPAMADRQRGPGPSRRLPVVICGPARSISPTPIIGRSPSCPAATASSRPGTGAAPPCPPTARCWSTPGSSRRSCWRICCTCTTPVSPGRSWTANAPA